MARLIGLPVDELKLGDRASHRHRVSAGAVAQFAQITGDLNPLHFDAAFARDHSRFGGVIVHGQYLVSLLIALLGMRLPGPGTILVGQSFDFVRPGRVGDELEVAIEVVEIGAKRGRLTLRGAITSSAGELLRGTVEVIAPRVRVEVDAPSVIALADAPTTIFDDYLKRAQKLAPVRTAVVHPVDADSLGGAIDAWQSGLIEPVLIAPKAKLDRAAEALGRSLDGLEQIAVEHSHAAADKAAELARRGAVQSIMKGALHTDELLKAVLNREAGLRTDRRISHAFVLAVANYPRPLIVSDAAINIAPDLDIKADIARNAIGLAHRLGIERPRLAILAAVETVSRTMPATLDAAALCKMADRGQISGADLDGPLAFDNAIDVQAAATKGIESKVAGQADILLVPNLEAGNILVKQLIFLGRCEAAGIVLGARIPIMLTSRADSAATRLHSCAIARLMLGDD